ncbi:MAG: hypothetical protein H0T62_14180 [Parachlamydiaceae bacterium]|nr:hypothetical protein [Parachlamydiaceae bacterium]
MLLDICEIESLMCEGALPTAETLEIVMSRKNFYPIKFLLEFLIKFGAVASTETLNFAIIDCRNECDFEDIIRILLKSGGIPTTETLNLACDELPLEAIKCLLEFGAEATLETLNILIMLPNSTDKVDFILKKGVTPTEITLNLSLNYSSKVIIQKILDLGVIPTKETLKIAKQLAIKKNKKKDKLIYYDRKRRATRNLQFN